MECRDIQEWLMEAEDLRQRAGFPAELARHLSDCGTCATFADELAGLEADWRAAPVPAEAEVARLAFLERLPTPAVSTLLERPRPVRPLLARWAVAAVLLLGLGIATWLLSSASEAQAAPVVIEQLVDLNLRLAQAPSADERLQIFSSLQAADVRRSLQQSHLSPADQELAEMLLANSSSLIATVDPLSEAERFSSVADKLVERLETVTDARNQPAVERYARMQRHIAERGVNGSLARAAARGQLTPERLEKIAHRDAKRAKALKRLLDSDDANKKKEAHPRHPKKDGAKSKKTENFPQQ